MISISYRSPDPIYAQVTRQLKDLLFSGSFPEGSRLPSVRELATELAINPNTIQRAYRELETEGFITTVPGKGCYVAATQDLREIKIKSQTEKLSEILRELINWGVDPEKLQTVTSKIIETSRKETAKK